MMMPKILMITIVMTAIMVTTMLQDHFEAEEQHSATSRLPFCRLLVYFVAGVDR